MKLIESKTLASSAASIEFTSIPQTYTDLVILFSGRNTSNISGEQWAFGNLGINADGSTVNQSGQNLVGRSNASGEAFSAPPRFYTSSSTSTSNSFSSGSIYFPNYTGSTQKSISIDGTSADNSVGGTFLVRSFGLWSGTAAITSVTLFPRASTGDFAIGSTASIYGVLKGSGGASVS